MTRDPASEAFLPLPTAVFHILIALADRDRHGYSIMQDVAARTERRVQLSAGTLYSSIRRMLEQGLIEELSRSPDRTSTDERRRYHRPPRRGCGSRAAQRTRAAGPRDRPRTRELMPQVTLYRALLRCYPAAFRDEYGEQMLLAFTDQLNDAPGSTARAAIWTGAACDVLAVAPREH